MIHHCVLFFLRSAGTIAQQKNAAGDQESLGMSLLDVVVHAVYTVAATLEPTDRLALVVFSSNAQTLLPLTAMTPANLQTTITHLRSMQPTDSTNLWAGIDQGLQVFGGVEDVNRARVMVVLTDGQPNTSPVNGEVAALQSWKVRHGGRLPCTVHTFGFGYEANSTMLKDVAMVGNGLYGFIPDASFVGTAFINLVCNVLVITGSHTRLTVRTPLPFQTEQPHVQLTMKGPAQHVATLALGTLHADQPMVVLVDVQAGAIPPTAALEVVVEYLEVGVGWVTLTKVGHTPADPGVCAVQHCRMDVVRGIYQALKQAPFSLEDARAKITEVAQRLRRFPELRVQPLLDDLVQVMEGLKTRYSFDRWGAHYLKALAGAHFHQQCTNFKDPGLQGYGGAYFRELRAVADDIFVSLVPLVSAPRRGSGTRVSMSACHNSSNPCFAGWCLVRMADGTTQRVDSLRKNDCVAGPLGVAAKVVCVLKTNVQPGLMCVFASGLVITPYHPIRTPDHTWVLPRDLVLPFLVPQCTALYSFVLETGHTMVINGEECVTLGHHFTDPVVAHSYLGTDAVLHDMAAMPGWAAGWIERNHNCLVRAAPGALVSGFAPLEMCA